MKKTFLCIVLCLSMLSALSQPLSAKSLSELEKERKAINNDISNTQSQINSTQAEMDAVMREIDDLDSKLEVVSAELDTINQTLDETIQILANTERELAQAQEDRDNQFESFKARMRVMHEYGQASYLEVLFQATNIWDFLSWLEYVNSVAKNDQQMVDRMQAAEDKVSEKVEETARQKNTIEAMQYMKTAKMKELEETLDERKIYFEQLDADQQRYEAKLAQEQEDQKVIQAAYKKAKDEEEARKLAARQQQQQQAAVTYNGVMQWPAPGYSRISDTYGSRVHPINKRTETHTGVDLASAMGNNIVAAESGKVILASRNGGYGNCVIIDHGGGISTLYAHASKLLVSVGQTVKKGEVIAKVGSTGVSTGPHLHFEVRINGNHTNPKKYLGY